MKRLSKGFFLVSIPALMFLGCGAEETDPPQTPNAIQKKEKTPQEQVKQMANAAIDLLVRYPKSSARERTAIVMPLYREYLAENLQPKANEDVQDFYERICQSAFKAECEGVFPEEYEVFAIRALLDSLSKEYTKLESRIPMSDLTEPQQQLLEKNAFALMKEQVKTPPKGEKAPWIFVDHPLRRPKRSSNIVIAVIIDEKGDVSVLVNGKNQSEKGSLMSLPSSDPSSSPSNAKLLEILNMLESQWSAQAGAEAKAIQNGEKVPNPAGPVDRYIELLVRPSSPAWYIAWALSAFEEAGFDNPVLIVRANGDVPRLGIIPFPFAKQVNKVKTVPVKKEGAFTQPDEALTQKTLVKLVPANGVSAQDLTQAIDKLSGCKENPCGVMSATFTVQKWDE